jgi:hypothetical protein
MQRRWLVVVLVVLAASRTRNELPITVNAVIGDASFIAAFGRAPTTDDDADLRVATHLAFVEQLLRARTGSPERSRLLEVLHEYRLAHRFPHGEVPGATRPAFVDRATGARCAFGALVEASAGSAVVTAIDRDHHADYVTQMARDPRFVAWAVHSGFSVDELAMIQPSYSRRAEDIELDAGGSLQVAPHATPDLLALLRGAARWDSAPWDDPDAFRVELDGAIGDAGGLAYDIGVSGGWRWTLWRDHRLTGDVGIAADREGRLGRQLAVPIGLSYLVPFGYLGFLAGVHGGARIPIAGRDTTDWSAALDLQRNEYVHDWCVSLAFDRLAGVNFFGLVLTLRRRLGWAAAIP